VRTTPNPVDVSVVSGDARKNVIFGNFKIEQGVVTDTSFRYFDFDPATPGQQFRIIYTPAPDSTGNVYKISSTNPGQFYYNVFYFGNPGDAVRLQVAIPYPFVTQGANPVHVYSDFDAWMSGGTLCFMPMYDMTASFSLSGVPIVLGANYDAFGEFAYVELTGTVPDTGLVYVTVHLEYGLKHTAAYSKVTSSYTLTSDQLPAAQLGTFVIPNLQPHEFKYRFQLGDEIGTSTWSDWREPIVESENSFKKTPGVGGMALTTSDGTPVFGAVLKLYGPKGNYIGMAQTDEDGWYFFSYKHTGKAATFTVTMPSFGLTKQLLLKANAMGIVNFDVVVAGALSSAIPVEHVSGSSAVTWAVGAMAIIASCVLIGLLSSLASGGPAERKSTRTRASRKSP
jgi:hypothetical protein